MRDFDQEARPLATKKYNYDFDDIVRDYMMRTFAPFFQSGPALELGCYHGDSTVALVPHFPQLTVVEASAECIAIARARVPGNVAFVQASIEDYAPAERFRSIFAVNTLEHVDDAVATLDRLRGLLSADGRLYLLVPNANAPSRQLAALMGLVSHNQGITDAEWTHGHRRTYAFDTLQRDVTRAGLTALQQGGILFKGLANFQMDRALEAGIISPAYIEACYRLGKVYPDLCASLYMICARQES